MSLAVVYSRANLGIHAPLVEVEVHLSPGLPKMTIVGLPETVVKESKDRVRSAIVNSQFEFPTKRITINLAPADLPKEGGRYDLPIALGILAASQQISTGNLAHYEFGGELTLSGELRAFSGVLPMIIAARDSNRGIILPENFPCIPVQVQGAKIFTAPDLLAVCQHLIEYRSLTPYIFSAALEKEQNVLDLQDVCGQYQAKRALEIAAAGGHSLLMKGPPGSGKTMLANRLMTILPTISESESLEVASLYSVAAPHGDERHYLLRPFRSPHHSASHAALVGGGRFPKPGEVSLAHHGVLFLDELPEFNRASLEALREPLEAGMVTISRAAYSMQYPARFQLIAAMNPCPCGYWQEGDSRCTCTIDQVKRYQQRLSGPLLDRIDLFVTTSPVEPGILVQEKPQQRTSSQEVRARVLEARQKQLARAEKLNAMLANAELTEVCRLNKEGQAFIHKAMQQFHVSARSYHRILKVARTIADLDHQDHIQLCHLQEAWTLKQA